MQDRDKIIASHPLLFYLTSISVPLFGDGKQRTSFHCAKTVHKKDHRCVSVDLTRQIWHCNDCDVGGSIIDWIMLREGKTAGDVMKHLSPEEDGPAVNQGASKIVKTYDYTNEQGQLLYQVVRFEPKTFRQRQPDDQGEWRWTMDGVTRVLYRLPEVLKSDTVVIVEGEKDADTLAGMGFASTCNVGGAGKWLGSYTDYLVNKDVIVIPDNDNPGKEHAAKVIASMSGKVASAKVVEMPSPSKDASDWAATFPNKEASLEAFRKLFEKTPHTIKPTPVFVLKTMEQHYRECVRDHAGRQLDLGKFLPSFRKWVRPMVPGELVLLFGNTGIGKTVLLQSIARSASPLPTLLFELELPLELVFERFVQMEVGCTAEDVQEEYQTHEDPMWTAYKGLTHIMVCPESGLSPEQVEFYIDRSELKFGVRPAVVLIDYVGLVQSKGKSRYEQVSYSAEQMKIIAKRTGTVIVMASQIGRQDSDEPSEPHLYSSKDSGSLENSAGLVLGVWRPKADTICLRILKNTKGHSGGLMTCNFDGARMKITERGPIADADIPRRHNN